MDDYEKKLEEQLAHHKQLLDSAKKSSPPGGAMRENAGAMDAIEGCLNHYRAFKPKHDAIIARQARVKLVDDLFSTLDSFGPETLVRDLHKIKIELSSEAGKSFSSDEENLGKEKQYPVGHPLYAIQPPPNRPSAPEASEREKKFLHEMGAYRDNGVLHCIICKEELELNKRMNLYVFHTHISRKEFEALSKSSNAGAIDVGPETVKSDLKAEEVSPSGRAMKVETSANPAQENPCWRCGFKYDMKKRGFCRECGAGNSQPKPAQEKNVLRIAREAFEKEEAKQENQCGRSEPWNDNDPALSDWVNATRYALEHPVFTPALISEAASKPEVQAAVCEKLAEDEEMCDFASNEQGRCYKDKYNQDEYQVKSVLMQMALRLREKAEKEKVKKE